MDRRGEAGGDGETQARETDFAALGEERRHSLMELRENIGPLVEEPRQVVGNRVHRP